jgi:hypothetical protein
MRCDTIPRFLKPRAMLAACHMLFSCLPQFSALKMEAKCSSETSNGFELIARRYIPEEITRYIVRFYLNIPST